MSKKIIKKEMPNQWFLFIYRKSGTAWNGARSGFKVMLLVIDSCMYDVKVDRVCY